MSQRVRATWARLRNEASSQETGSPGKWPLGSPSALPSTRGHTAHVSTAAWPSFMFGKDPDLFKAPRALTYII